MKKYLIMFLLINTSSAYGHDGGHGPKLGDQPKFGGKVAAVINKTEIKKGTKASMLYKAELTKNNQNVVRVYIYDKNMKPIKLDSFKNASGNLLFKDRRTKKMNSHEFPLAKKDGLFEGTLPTNPRRPFSIDLTIGANKKTLFVAFDNLN